MMKNFLYARNRLVHFASLMKEVSKSFSRNPNSSLYFDKNCRSQQLATKLHGRKLKRNWPVVLNTNLSTRNCLKLDFPGFLNSSAKKCFIQQNEFFQKSNNTSPCQIHFAGFCLALQMSSKILQSRVKNFYLFASQFPNHLL